MSCSGPIHLEELPWELGSLAHSLEVMTVWSCPHYCLMNTYLSKPYPCMEQSLHLGAVQKHVEKHFRDDLWEGCSLSTVANPRSYFQREVWERSQHWTSHLLLLLRAEPSAGASSPAPAGNAEVPPRQAPGRSLPCPWVLGGVGRRPEESHQPNLPSTVATPLFEPLCAGRQKWQHRERLLGTEQKTNSNKRSLKADLSSQTCGKMPAAFLTSPRVLSRAPGILAMTVPRAGWLQRRGQGSRGAGQPTWGPGGSSSAILGWGENKVPEQGEKPDLSESSSQGTFPRCRAPLVILGHLSSHLPLWVHPAFDPALRSTLCHTWIPGLKREGSLILNIAFYLGRNEKKGVFGLCDCKEKFENIKSGCAKVSDMAFPPFVTFLKCHSF